MAYKERPKDPMMMQVVSEISGISGLCGEGTHLSQRGHGPFSRYLYSVCTITLPIGERPGGTQLTRDGPQSGSNNN